MFAFLRGTVADKTQQHIALDVNGVGYEVLVPEGVYRRLVPNQEVTLLTYCHIREDTFLIFGFLKEEERTLFKMLLGVSSVGPRVALSVMSAMSVQDFARAILENDVKAVSKAQGVGTKLAQRIILELKAKTGQDAELNAILGEPKSAEPEGDDVYDALMALGCTPQEARKATAQARKELGDGAKDEELVRVALRSMSKAK